MRDFPMFTTEYGIASLVLKEVPYRQEAYIIIRSTEDSEELLKECVSFCRMVGAEKVYAKGHPILEAYPLHTIIYEMRGTAQVDPDMVENIFPVTEDTVGRWREIYNEKMRSVDCAATQTSKDEKTILGSAGTYFVHSNGNLLGIGWMEDTELRAICAAEPGAGRRVMHTLMSTVEGEQIYLEVASTNLRAIRFYESLGFLKTGEKSRWYRVV